MNRQTTRISPADVAPPAGFLPEAPRAVRRPAVRAPGLCGHLRLPAERGRLGAAAGLPQRDGVPVHPERGGGRPDCHQHLRHPGARRDAGAGQRGRAGAHQAGQARPAHLRVRLHGPGAPHGAEDQGLLPAGGSGLRPPRPVAVPGAALPPCDPPGAHLRHRRRARLHRRGHPPGAPGGGEGVGEHHVRLQQLLHLLHRALRPGAGALPEAGDHPGRDPRPGGRGVQGHHPAGPERQLLRQGSGRAHGLRRPAQGRLGASPATSCSAS